MAVPAAASGAETPEKAGSDAPDPARVDASSMPVPAGQDAAVPAAQVDAGAAGGGALDAGTADAGAEPAAGYLVFEVATKPSAQSTFAPRNLLAIWVEDAAGAPIKPLGLWGASRRLALRRFFEQFPGAANFVPDPSLLVDAVTAATLRDHGTRTVRWDLTDTHGAIVPHGDYAVVVESTDNLQFTMITSVPFTKGDEPITLLVPASAEFGPLTLVYVP